MTFILVLTSVLFEELDRDDWSGSGAFYQHIPSYFQIHCTCVPCFHYISCAANFVVIPTNVISLGHKFGWVDSLLYFAGTWFRGIWLTKKNENWCTTEEDEVERLLNSHNLRNIRIQRNQNYRISFITKVKLVLPWILHKSNLSS